MRRIDQLDEEKPRPEEPKPPREIEDELENDARALGTPKLDRADGRSVELRVTVDRPRSDESELTVSPFPVENQRQDEPDDEEPRLKDEAEDEDELCCCCG